jgi:hypothetical protein
VNYFAKDGNLSRRTASDEDNLLSPNMLSAGLLENQGFLVRKEMN